MKRAALYIRVSSDKQVKEGDSIPAQREALRKYAKEHNFLIAGEYIDDGISSGRVTVELRFRLYRHVVIFTVDLLHTV